MAADIPTTEPQSVTAGDTLQWTIALPDYPASDGWTLKYNLVGAAGQIAIESTPDSDDHLVSVSPATSAVYTPGRYRAAKYVEKGADETLERVTLGTLDMVVAPNLAGATAASDTRSHARKVLDALEALIEGRATRSDKSYTIDISGSRRSIESLTVIELLEARDRYASMVWQEESGGQLIVPVRTRFVR